jgi:hypothetical protein
VGAIAVIAVATLVTGALPADALPAGTAPSLAIESIAVHASGRMPLVEPASVARVGRNPAAPLRSAVSSHTANLPALPRNTTAHKATKARFTGGKIVIKGTQRVGRTLTASIAKEYRAKPAPAGISYTYRWYRAGQKKAVSKKPTYTLKMADFGKTVTLKVTVKATGKGKKAYEPRVLKVATATIGKAKPTGGALIITGKYQKDMPITARITTPFDISPSPAATEYTYRWYQGKSATPFAEKTTTSTRMRQVVTEKQEKSSIRVTVTVRVTGKRADRYATRTLEATASQKLSYVWPGLRNGRVGTKRLCQVSWSTIAWFQCDGARALERAAKAGMPREEFTSTYRTLAQQVLVKQQLPLWAADPGRSMHGWGLALDAAEPMRAWLQKHGAEYRWYPNIVPGEPWHFEYHPYNPW